MGNSAREYWEIDVLKCNIFQGFCKVLKSLKCESANLRPKKSLKSDVVDLNLCTS